MILIGLTGWGDHDTLYTEPSKNKLEQYAAHFPVVEVDSSFYAIQPVKNAEKWVKQTPDSFRFVVKAFQGMTLHKKDMEPFQNIEMMFEAFLESIKPYLEAKKLEVVLFQFPPWFDCTRRNVNYLRKCKELMKNTPVALEFRHRSWFTELMEHQTISFMKKEGWIHSICDEPQIGQGCVPTILEPTNEKTTLVRLHGRNTHGWLKPKEGNWREVRYLYRYNHNELQEWKEKIEKIKSKSKNLTILFNNNSGGDAADNAKQLKDLLGLDFEGLAPKQLHLFE
ncbi:DUF72 domain-containing protein [Bacillus carboniphilus]|uniref:DUF72 domain-containing protein n=1 Tax=Bacillus carboniphilus TaxID=86663 RepID=A0ABY9JSS9_9BACI|nr:DUF72 domain-containing protein [Bacillus carboniphilus]WLR41313.1 DUF72 domain-containing protein [Bacillus carboniphilus]